MRSSRKILFAAIGIALLVSPLLFAQVHREIPLRNWTVPAFDAATLGNPAGIRPMTHIQGNNPAVFVPIAPCRLEDSRTTAVPAGPGPIGGPGVGAERDYDFIPGGGDTCTGGFSEPILALSLNFSIIGAFGPGFLYAYPDGGTPPPVSILNYNAGEIRNNAAIVPVNASTGAITVGTGVNGTDVIIDINGIFLNALEPNTSFTVISEVDDAAIIGQNTSTALNAQGMRGVISSTTPGSGSAAVRAQNNSTTANGVGLWASHAGDGYAVIASSVNGTAIQGFSTGVTAEINVGVWGLTNSTGIGSAGVLGNANATTGVIYGVRGLSASSSSNSAGVFGLGDVSPPGASTTGAKAGVRGVSDGFGVLGISDVSATTGLLLNAAGTVIARGDLGRLGGDAVGCGGIAEPVCPPQWGVLSLGSIGASGTKFFLDPHPTDPSKVIGYISLEGPEAGTYFRGRARFQNGIARIAVPEHFRLVTDPEGLTVQITPIGGMATVGVLRVDLNEIVVQSSRNLEFSYLVQGVRNTFKDTLPVWQGTEFRPESAEDKLPAWLSEGQKARLIANGTYRADGSVNMETAQRLGWDRVWAERQTPKPQPVEP